MAAIRCSKCSALYPSDMDTCPSCGYSPLLGMNVNFNSTPDPTPTELNPRTVPVGRAPTPVKARKNPDKRESPVPGLTPCKACKCNISLQAEVCPHCGQPTGIHLCPKCSSTNTKVISGASKVTSILLWGPFAANKVVSKYQCNNCGHKF